DLQRVQADALPVVVDRVADLDEHLLQRGLREGRSRGKEVRRSAGWRSQRVVVDVQSYAVSPIEPRRERPVQNIGAESLLGLDHRLTEMFGVDLADLDMISVLDQHLGQCEGETVDLVDVALNEQHAA